MPGFSWDVLCFFGSKGGTGHNPRFRSGAFCSPPGGRGIYIHYLKFFTVDFSVLLNLFTYSIIKYLIKFYFVEPVESTLGNPDMNKAWLMS